MTKGTGAVVLACLGAVACGVPATEAQELLKGLTAVGSADPSMRTPLLLKMCSELKKCADGCEKGLELAATLVNSKEMGDTVGPMLAQCYSDLKKEHARNPGLKPTDWFRGYFARYVARAREALGPEDQRKLDAASVFLGAHPQ